MHLIHYMDLTELILTCGQTGSWQRCWQRHFSGFLKGCCQLSKQTKISHKLCKRVEAQINYEYDNLIVQSFHLGVLIFFFLHDRFGTGFTSKLNLKQSNLFITVTLPERLTLPCQNQRITECVFKRVTKGCQPLRQSTATS